MITIKEIQANPSYELDYIDICFSINDTTEDITKYRFDLYRANYETDEFKPVFFNLKDFHFKDYSVNLRNPESIYYYKIKVINLETKEFLFSDDKHLGFVSPDIYLNYFNYIYSTYLNLVINSRDMHFLKRMHSGELCECYDDVYGSRKQDKCLECFGTGYKYGFYPAINIKVNFSNVQSKTEEMNITGTFEGQNSIQFWTLGFPIMSEGDMIIDSLNKKRYIVKNWQPSIKDGALIRQTVVCDDLPETNILYKVPLRME